MVQKRKLNRGLEALLGSGLIAKPHQEVTASTPETSGSAEFTVATADVLLSICSGESINREANSNQKPCKRSHRALQRKVFCSPWLSVRYPTTGTKFCLGSDAGGRRSSLD